MRSAGSSVFTLIVLLMTAVPASTSSSDRTTAGLDIQRIEVGLEMYRVLVGNLPTKEEGLEALLRPLPPDGTPVMKRLPVDPWGNAYSYTSNGVEFSVVSAGPDERVGTEDDVTRYESNSGLCSGCACL